MMLNVPLATPFTHFRGCSDVGSGPILANPDAERQRCFRLGDVANLAHGSPAAGSASIRRRCIVSASGNESAGGLPAGRQAAERRKVLLKYVREVQPALVEQFVSDGPPAVVAAMKNTITNMLGTLPPQFFTVTISTVGENMSQLMLSVMMTGYLFRSAQLRLELRNVLGGSGSSSAAHRTPAHPHGSTPALQRSQSAPQQSSVLDQEAYAPGVQKSRVQGDVLLWHKENGLETLEAVQYIELLEDEVSRLRQQLSQITQAQTQPQMPPQQQQQQHPPPLLPQPQQPDQSGVGQQQLGGRQLPVPMYGSRSLQQAGQSSGTSSQSGGPAGLLVLHEESNNELLEFLRGLDAASVAELTSCADSEVAAAMEGFVARLMGTSDRDSLSRAGSDCTAQELAKVMLWLMIVGYTLRGLEVRWDMQKAALADHSSGGQVRLSADNSHEAW